MRKLAAVLLFVAAVPSLFAQSKKKAEPLPPLVEKIDVSVVNVDVTVTDRKGNSVSGLTKDDFEVFEDGKPQPITNFYALDDAAAATKPALRAAQPAPPAPEIPEKYRRKVLVLIDNVNTAAHARNEALARLEEFINDRFQSGTYDWSIATIGSTARLLLPPTSDKQKLHDAIAAIRHSGSIKEMTAPIQRAETGTMVEGSNNSVRADDQEGATLHNRRHDLVVGDRMFMEEAQRNDARLMATSSVQALGEVARAFATTEGKKIILLVTGSLPLGTSNPFRIERIRLGDHSSDMQRNDNRLVALRDALVREANASNTSFYIIGAEGPEMAEQGPPTEFPSAGTNAPDTSAAYWLASETGGAFMPGNSVALSLQEFDRRSATFYSLGFVPRHPSDNRYHRVTVRVKNHAGLHLQYRDGYSSVTDDVQIERTLRSMIGVSLQPSTLPVSLVADKPLYGEKAAVVPLVAEMKMDDLQYITDAAGSRTRLDVWVSVFDRDGRNVTLTKFVSEVGVGSSETATGPMTVSIPGVALTKGSYRIVVAVRDQLTDRVGVAVRKIDI